MGAYDAVYARCNCDWPDDERCKALPDDQCRWFNHLLWLESVRQKTSVLPERFDAAYWSTRLGVSIERIEFMVRAMAAESLIAWSDDGRLVVIGTNTNHPKLTWREPEPENLVNPFKKRAGWLISGYPEKSPDTSPISPDTKRYPEESPTVEKSIEEKRRVEKRREEESTPLASPPEAEIESILSAWQSEASKADRNIESPRTLTAKRKTAAKARLRDGYFVANWKEAIAKVGQSRFCNGVNQRGWRANLDWFLSPDTVVKIMEGKYDNRGAVVSPGIFTEEVEFDEGGKQCT